MRVNVLMDGVNLMTADDMVTLRSGPLELLISPTAGGSIARFDWIKGEGRIPILRGCNTQPKSVLDAASFPLVPFVNRIKGGKFTFRRREIRIAPNMDGDPSPLHGQGWLNPWTIVSQDEAGADFLFVHAPGEWPWAYEAHQLFRLDPGGLSLTLTCRNLSGEPMPCGLGQHPYFPCTSATRIDTQVEHAWTIDEHVLPVEKVPATGRFDLNDRPVCAQDFDHGFGGWSGSARVSTPGTAFAVVLSSPEARFFQLYSPKGGGLFVAEPVTHANAAMNAPEEEWDDLGFRVLEPGEEMSLTMRLEVIPV